MILKIYGVKDNVEGEFVFFFQSTNEGVMKRVVKSALLDKQPNAISTNLKDKSIYDLGEIDTQSGEIKPNVAVFVVSVAELRLELIKEIKIAKTEAGEKEPNADEVVSDE